MYTLDDISVYIFNWKKVTTNSLKLYEKIGKIISNTCIINCDETYKLPPHISHIQLDDSHYYGSQYEHAINHVRVGSIFCVIVGDTIADNDYETLFKRACDIFNTYDVGVYAPHDKRSVHQAKLEQINDTLYNVSNTDCGFWFIHPTIVSQMRDLPYSCSTYGYGVDIITIRHAREQGLKVIRDYSTSTDQLDHTTGYKKHEALAAMKKLIAIYEKSMNIKS